MKKRIRLVFILVTAGLLSGLIACGQAGAGGSVQNTPLEQSQAE